MSCDPFDIARLRDEGDGDLALQLETTAGLLDDHPVYKDQNHPSWLTGPGRLRECAANLKHASVAAKQDDSKEPERLVARDTAIQQITFAGQVIAMFSVHENDPSHLQIGLDLKHRNYSKEPPRKPEKKPNLQVKHTGVSGSLYASVNTWEGRGSVELQICDGDPKDEASWRVVNIFHSCRMRVEDLEPAKRIYFRARYRNDVGIGPWSEVVEIIVL